MTNIEVSRYRRSDIAMGGVQFIIANDMGATYADNIAPVIKNKNRVVITANDGKARALL